MPSRSSEWSSTARTRMALVLINCFLAFAKQPKTGTAAGDRVRDGAWDAQFHLCPGSGLAPNFELRANLLSPLAHPLQAPVTVTTHLCYAWIDSRSIIPNPQAQKALRIRDLRFDSGCLRMTKSIS